MRYKRVLLKLSGESLMGEQRYIVQKFARENYENVVYMNFILEPDKKSALAGKNI